MNCRNKTAILIVIVLAWLMQGRFAHALEMKTPEELRQMDTDNDGLSDYDEINVYRTDFNSPDTDKDGYGDGDEVTHAYDPNKQGDDKLTKRIEVTLKDQTLRYFLGQYEIGQFLISSGDRKHPTPPGQYQILAKKPTVNYKGADYNYPNTKWNLQFKRNGYYIHGAYWRKEFGKPGSHGCVNVSYANMEPLYNWADVGTSVIIR